MLSMLAGVVLRCVVLIYLSARALSLVFRGTIQVSDILFESMIYLTMRRALDCRQDHMGWTPLLRPLPAV